MGLQQDVVIIRGGVFRHLPKVVESIKTLQDTTMRLARQNELNRNLAEYCIDLANEESQLFQRAVTEDPNGCYDDGARPSGRGPGGVLQRQA